MLLFLFHVLICAYYHDILLPPGFEIATVYFFSCNEKMIEDFGVASLGVNGGKGLKPLCWAGTSHGLF